MGNGGNDIIDGGAGNDIITGSMGADTFIFGRGYGQDHIYYNYGPWEPNADTVQLSGSISADQIWLQQEGSDLKLSIIGTDDSLRISYWFASPEIGAFELSNGQRLLLSQVDRLIQAMAAFAPPAQGQTTLTPEYQAALGGIIASSWA